MCRVARRCADVCEAQASVDAGGGCCGGGLPRHRPWQLRSAWIGRHRPVQVCSVVHDRGEQGDAARPPRPRFRPRRQRSPHAPPLPARRNSERPDLGGRALPTVSTASYGSLAYEQQP